MQPVRVPPAGEGATEAGRPGAIRSAAVLRAMAGLLWAMRGWLLLLALSIGLLAAVEPSFAWMGKTVVDSLAGARGSLADLVARYGLSFAGLFLLITVLKVVEKIVNKAVSVRLVAALQRGYLDRRSGTPGASEVAQVFFGSEVAKKGFEVVYKDAWRITIQVVSIGIWQMTLAPEWLPAMIVATIPALVAVCFFGAPIQRASTRILDLQRDIAATMHSSDRAAFVNHQRSWLRWSLWAEFLKVAADESMDVLIWLSMLVLVALAAWAGSSLLPREVTAGDVALVVVNLRLLSTPLGDIGKVYAKWHEALPAMGRAFALHDDAPESSPPLAR